MIAAGRFDGDDADDVIMAQHDVYGPALAVIIRIVGDRWRDAHAIVGLRHDESLVFPPISNVDHRVLQDAHDLLAAIWRCERQLFHPVLQVKDLRLPELMADWLAWLDAYLRCAEGALVGAIARSMIHQNSEEGYAAEDRAIGVLKERLKSMRPAPRG